MSADDWTAGAEAMRTAVRDELLLIARRAIYSHEVTLLGLVSDAVRLLPVPACLAADAPRAE